MLTDAYAHLHSNSHVLPDHSNVSTTMTLRFYLQKHQRRKVCHPNTEHMKSTLTRSKGQRASIMSITVTDHAFQELRHISITSNQCCYSRVLTANVVQVDEDWLYGDITSK